MPRPRLKAGDAKAIADKNHHLVTDEVLIRIGNAARRGEYSITLSCKNFPFSKDMEEDLEELGYQVNHVPDQRDGDYYHISWDEPE